MEKVDLHIAKKIFNNAFIKLLMNKYPGQSELLQKMIDNADDAEEYCVQNASKCVVFTAGYNTGTIDSILLSRDENNNYIIDADWSDLVDHGQHDCKKYFKIFWENWLAENAHIVTGEINGEFDMVTSAFYIGTDTKNKIYISMKAYQHNSSPMTM